MSFAITYITILLIYFMMKTTSPKIIFVPFLICSISMAGKNIALLLNKEKYAALFSKLFVAGFLLFWFGFLIVAFYISVRDKNYKMIVFSLPFWLIGIILIKNKLLKKRSQNQETASFHFAIVISAGLVIIAFLAGILLSVLGITRHDTAMTFAGAFFTFVSFTFILVALTAMGCFDKIKFDIIGMYVGVLFVAIGLGFIAMKYSETLSLLQTLQSFGFWILIPLLLVVVGIVQISNCLRKSNK